MGNVLVGVMVLPLVGICIVGAVLIAYGIFWGLVLIGYGYVVSHAPGEYVTAAEIQVVNVPKDARKVYVLLETSDGLKFVELTGPDLVNQKFRKWDWHTAKRYGVLTEDERGEWRLWWVERSGGQPTITIPDSPPERLAKDEVLRRFNIGP
jgi:hypothetical protein